MDIVPLPTSSGVSQPIQPTDIAAPNPAAYSPTPALDALQNAYSKGMIQASDILPLIKGTSDTQKSLAVNSADIQQANLRKQVQPAQAGVDIASAHTATAQSLADRGLIPATTAAKAAAAKALATQSSLADLTAQVQIPETAFALKQATENPEGTHAALTSIWKSVQPGLDLPKTASGDVNYPAMIQGLYGYYSNPDNQQGDSAATSGAPSAPTGSELDKLPPSPASHILHDKVIQYWNSQYYDTPEGKAVMEGIKTKNAQDILTNPDGTSKPYWQVKTEVANTPDRWIGDAGAKAMEDFNTNLAPQRAQLNQATELVNQPGMVGLAVGSGDWLGTARAQVAAALHLDPAKLNSQEQIDQAIKGQMRNVMGQVHNIRNQYEFNAVIGSIPSIRDNPPVWNNWLNRAQKVIDDSAGVYKEHMPVEANSGRLELPPATPVPQSVPSLPAAGSSTPVTTVGQYNAVPPGGRYFDGKNWRIKQATLEQAGAGAPAPTNQTLPAPAAGSGAQSVLQ